MKWNAEAGTLTLAYKAKEKLGSFSVLVPEGFTWIDAGRRGIEGNLTLEEIYSQKPSEWWFRTMDFRADP